MIDIALWSFAAIGAAFTAYHGAWLSYRVVKVTVAWSARRRVWAKETRIITITRIVASQALIDFARNRTPDSIDGRDETMAILQQAGVEDSFFVVEGTVRLNNGRSEPFEHSGSVWGEYDSNPAAMDILRAIAGHKDYLPAVDFRPAVVEAMVTEEVQVAA
jgi:hypothetical protein